MDLAAIYASAHGRIGDLLSGLPERELGRPVPGTPAWSVHELTAHLAGVAADVVAGNLDGVATDPWTARQVAERRGRTVADLLAEWSRSAPGVVAIIDRMPPAAVDVFTHEHDLRGALGLAGSSDPAVTATMVGRLASTAHGPRFDRAGLPALRLVGDDAAWVAGSGPVGATVTAPTVELFRALMGRRSAGQVLSYAWEGDPSPYLDLFNLFGELPSEAVAEAGAPA